MIEPNESNERDAPSKLRYPIGQFAPPEVYTSILRERYLTELAACPGELRRAVAGLSETQLDTPYRAQGWTVRQVVHHVPDSHMNAYVRHKLATTEEQPAIRLYDEALWAELPEARTAETELSLTLLAALHARWDRFLRSLAEETFARTFLHPSLGPVTLDQSVGMYAWHSRHHVAQIDALRRCNGW
ncbi:MAG: YfiT family bacillithiol transferase [Thermoanaerobaculia bacterium]